MDWAWLIENPTQTLRKNWNIIFCFITVWSTTYRFTIDTVESWQQSCATKLEPRRWQQGLLSQHRTGMDTLVSRNLTKIRKSACLGRTRLELNVETVDRTVCTPICGDGLVLLTFGESCDVRPLAISKDSKALLLFGYWMTRARQHQIISASQQDSNRIPGDGCVSASTFYFSNSFTRSNVAVGWKTTIFFSSRKFQQLWPLQVMESEAANALWEVVWVSMLEQRLLKTQGWELQCGAWVHMWKHRQVQFSVLMPIN